jgi:hypothetical protein
MIDAGLAKDTSSVDSHTILGTYKYIVCHFLRKILPRYVCYDACRCLWVECVPCLPFRGLELRWMSLR